MAQHSEDEKGDCQQKEFSAARRFLLCLPSLYFKDNSLPIIQETVDFSSGGRVREKIVEKCTNYFVFLGDLQAIKYIVEQDTKSKIVIISTETPWEVKDFLKSHLSKNYLNLLIMAYSASSRNDGSYLLYTHKLYAEGSGSTQPMLLSSWINNNLTIRDVNLFPEKLTKGFMGHRLLVSAAENPPFTIKKSLWGSDDSNWDGIEIRLLKLSAKYLNFTIEFTDARTSAYSPIDAVKRDVLLGLTSAAVGGIYLTQELSESFDATLPHAEDCAAFISLASTAIPKYRAILGPFQLSVWLLLCAAYFVLIIPLSFNSNYTILSLFKHPSGLNNMFWFVFSTYTNSFVVENPLLNYGIAKNSITILLGIYWIFTIIVTACYTGSIVAFITLPVYPSAIESAAEFLAYRYRIGTLDHNGWENWFNVNTTDDPLLQSLFRKMEYLPTLLEGVHNASRAYFWPYAFLASKTSLEYIIQTDFAPTWTTKRTLMHVSDECFVRYNVVQLFPAKSLYTKSMNGFVARVTETGLLDKIINDIEWEMQRVAMMTKKQITKSISKKIKVEDRELTVEDTQGMFLILGSGFLMAMLALALESLYSYFKKRNIKKDSVSEMEGTDWMTESQVMGSWIYGKDAFPGMRQRPARGSV
ncbi:ionotropic receptor 21a isoform X1 [Nasonia vitripennis]|uniref:Ionotropic glutamate receptor C-terminal domain-containing protein n=2 Tax=Nasonia vitripennis TaxID=7425 RepID=A0A7M7IUM4_NASVI|nr:ionotropic receptor 21a isoform X1 [Nasonia vitripennis]